LSLQGFNAEYPLTVISPKKVLEKYPMQNRG
jgi:hypothetical protein